MEENLPYFFRQILSRGTVLSTDVDIKNWNGKTALHYAVVLNNLSLVQQLLDKGANVDAIDRDHKTPLHNLVWINEDESHLKVAKLLLKNGADIHAKDYKGETAFCQLVKHGNVKIVKLFLNFKADIHAKDFQQGNSALCLAAARNENRNVKVIQLLVDLGSHVNHRNNRGYTPIDWACDSAPRNIQIIKCLLKNGANMNNVDLEGSTPLIKAADVMRMFGDFFVEENMKKNLNFIIRNTDFNLIHNNVKILSHAYKPKSNFVWKTVIEHLAKLEELNILVHHEILNKISSIKKFNDFYKQCQEELLKAKSIKLKNSWVTFYNLLVDGRLKLKNYAGNKDLVKDYKKTDCVEKFPIYGASMIANMEKGIKKRKLVDKSTILLSYCLSVFNPTHLVIRDIIDCNLSNKDLSKFCRKKFQF